MDTYTYTAFGVIPRGSYSVQRPHSSSCYIVLTYGPWTALHTAHCTLLVLPPHPFSPFYSPGILRERVAQPDIQRRIFLEVVYTPTHPTNFRSGGLARLDTEGALKCLVALHEHVMAGRKARKASPKGGKRRWRRIKRTG